MTDPTHLCEHPFCHEEGVPCYLDDDLALGLVGKYLCPEHAFAAGHCCICGLFWRGVESFDFGAGLCEQCQSQVDADTYGEDGDSDDYEYMEGPL